MSEIEAVKKGERTPNSVRQSRNGPLPQRWPAKQITIGDRTLEVRRPKLGDIRFIVDALDNMAGKAGGELIEASFVLVVAGLQSANPGITVDDLSDLETDIQEVNAAVEAILEVSGLRTAETPPGEGVPQPVVN